MTYDRLVDSIKRQLNIYHQSIEYLAAVHGGEPGSGPGAIALTFQKYPFWRRHFLSWISLSNV